MDSDDATFERQCRENPVKFDPVDPKEAGWFLRKLRDDGTHIEDSCILENLFSPARILKCQEAVFLKDENGKVLSLAIIAFADRPEVFSYYTLPEHRCKAHYGYRLLVYCIERLLEKKPHMKVLINTTSDDSFRHCNRLPAHLKQRVGCRHTY
jgi:hypothetical protein